MSSCGLSVRFEIGFDENVADTLVAYHPPMGRLFAVLAIGVVVAFATDKTVVVWSVIVILGVAAWWRAYRNLHSKKTVRTPLKPDRSQAMASATANLPHKMSEQKAPALIHLDEQQKAVLRSAIATKSGPRWIAAHETFAIGPRLIRLAFCFVGSVPTPGSQRVDPGYVIDTTQWVDWNAAPSKDVALDYVRYAAFDPAQRALFLEWYHRGRRDDSIGAQGVQFHLRCIASRVAQCGASLREEDASSLLDELNRVCALFGTLDGVAAPCARLIGMIHGIMGARSTSVDRRTRFSGSGISAADEPIVVSQSPAELQSQGYSILSAIKSRPPQWISQPERVQIAGREVTITLSYVGTTGLAGDDDPATQWTIDPTRPVLWEGNSQVEIYPYRPAYDGLSPAARGAYLRWHDGGRIDPSMAVTYVELFLMGISAHVGQNHGALPSGEVAHLAQELSRLDQLYFRNSPHQSARCSELLVLLPALDDELPAPTAPEPFVPNHPYWAIPPGFPIRLGRVLKAGEPVSPSLALEWLMVTGNSFRTPVERAPDAFQSLFANRLEREYPRGFILPTPKSRLAYRVWCPTRGSDWRTVTTHLPDYSRLSAPLDKLRAVVLASTEELEPFSRYLGREGTDKADTTEARLLLPESIWPKDLVDAIDALASRIREGMLVLKVDELLAALGSMPREHVLSKAGWERLSSGFLKRGLALEWAAKGPPTATVASSTMDPRVAVFHVGPVSASPPPHRADGESAFDQATLALQLALFLVQNDVAARPEGDTTLGGRDLARLQRAVMAQPSIDANDRRRLIARLRLRHEKTVTLPPLRKAIGALSPESAGRLLRMLGDVAHEDGEVSPAEIGALRKIYRAFGRNQDDVYALPHGAASCLTAAASDQSAQSGASSVKILRAAGGSVFQLDATRLAALEAETHAVQTMLAQIFVDDAAIDDDQLEPAKATESETSSDQGGRPDFSHAKRVDSPMLVGLDASHDGLARAMLGKQEHRRDELIALARGCGLMLDGALERINEAAYDTWDAPFAEGEDPLELSPEAIRFRDTLAGRPASSAPETSSITP